MTVDIDVERNPGSVRGRAMLPELHGFDIARRIKGSGKYGAIPIIMVSAVYRGWRIAEDLKQNYGVEEYLEKPFRIGHYIRLGGNEGTVESVGFRSTRIRTPDNSLLSIPNDSVINTTVENLTLRPKRRQRFTVGVTYDTPRATLAAFVDGIRAVILDTELADKDNVQVSFNNLGDSSLDILVVFHLLVTDYHLSNSETGTQVIASLRASLGAHLKAVLITGDTSSAVRDLQHDEKTRLARKPIHAEELLTLLKSLLAT